MEKNEKFAFTMGLSVGVAFVSLVGVIIMGIIFLNSSFRSSGGELSLEVIKSKIVNDKLNSVAQDKKTNNKSNNTFNNVEGANLPGEKINGVWTRGNKNAPVTIVEYSDYQCPYCSRHHATLKKIMESYPNLVKWEYKHFPLDSMHPYARITAEGAECAGDQGKFWAYSDLLYENQKSIKNEIIPQLAEQLGLDMDEFTSCISSGKYKEKIANDLTEGQKRGVKGTPGNFVNGIELKGAVPFEQVKAAIDKELNK